MLLYQSYVVFVRCPRVCLNYEYLTQTVRGLMKSYLWLMQSYIHSICNNRICSFFYSTKPYNVWLKCRDQYEDKFWEKVELLRNSLRKRWISKLDLKLNCSELSLHAFYVISFFKLFDLVSPFAYITLYNY